MKVKIGTFLHHLIPSGKKQRESFLTHPTVSPQHIFIHNLSGIQLEKTAIELHCSEGDNYSTSISAERRSTRPFKAFSLLPKGRPSLRLKSDSQGPDEDDV